MISCYLAALLFSWHKCFYERVKCVGQSGCCNMVDGYCLKHFCKCLDVVRGAGDGVKFLLVLRCDAFCSWEFYNTLLSEYKKCFLFGVGVVCRTQLLIKCVLWNGFNGFRVGLYAGERMLKCIRKHTHVYIQLNTRIFTHVYRVSQK